MPTQILGVKIDNNTKKEVLEKIESFLKYDKQSYIVTPNPEFLVAANKDNEFKQILNSADLSIPDGTGLMFASWLTKEKIKQRITGVDLVYDICQIAQNNNQSIYLLGGEKGIGSKTADILLKKYSKLIIAGVQDGMKVEDTSLNSIIQANPGILLVAFGQVKQEKWIHNNLNKLPSVKLAIGIGGAFDYIAEKILRSPIILRRLGLEWLFRLLIEPKRAKRIYNAVIKFPILVIIDKLKS